MGGIMSTRWDGHARRRTVEEMGRVLSVSNLRELLAVGTGETRRTAHITSATARFTWADGFALALTLRDDGPIGPRLELGDQDSNPTDRAGVIVLEQVPQPFSGARWWLLCPECGQRRGALYLAARRALEAPWPRCRECLGLGYTSQRLAREARLRRQRDALAEGLGVQHWGEWPERPKGMHRKRYEQEAEQLATLEAALDADFMGRATRLLGRGRR